MQSPPQPWWARRRSRPPPTCDAPGARICLPYRNKWWNLDSSFLRSGTQPATSTVLARLPQLAGPERSRPASSMREFPLVGDTTSNAYTPVTFGVTAVGNIFGSKALLSPFFIGQSSSDKSCEDNANVGGDRVAAHQRFRHINLGHCALITDTAPPATRQLFRDEDVASPS